LNNHPVSRESGNRLKLALRLENKKREEKLERKKVLLGRRAVIRAVLVFIVVIPLVTASLMLSQLVTVEGEWKLEKSLDTNGDKEKDLDIRTRDTNGDAKPDEIHLDFNRNGKIDAGEPSGPIVKWGYMHYSKDTPPFYKVWVIVETPFGNLKISWKIRDKNGDGKIDPGTSEAEERLEKPAGYKWRDPIQDLVYIYPREPVPVEKYVGYLDVFDADARNVGDSIEFHITVKGGIPTLMYNTFYIVFIDKNNDPADNCQTYPSHGADTMYSINLKTGKIERAIYQVVGDWWIVQSTTATFGLISAWPDGDTEIIFYVLKSELPTFTEMMPWRVLTDSDPYGIGDLAPDEGVVYVPLTPPIPWIVSPLSGTTLYADNVALKARDITFYNERQDILACSFECFLFPEGPWTEIGIDFDPADGWEVLWNLTGLAEGRYYIVATMWNTAGEAWSEKTTVFYDPTPPIPQFHQLSYGDTVEGLTTLQVKTLDENVQYVEFFYFTVTERKEKEIPGLCQKEIGTNPNAQDPHEGAYNCGPTAAAACLAYWGDYKNETGHQPYRNLYNGTTEGLVQMARDLYDLCKTNQDLNSPGTFGDKLTDGINSYIKNKELQDELQATFIENGDWTRAKDEFMSCQDVILLVSRPDGSRHWITLSAIENVEDENDQEITYVEFMEPWCGIEGATAVLKEGKLKFDWNGEGNAEDDELASVVHIVTVCPKDRENCPKDPLIGTDYDGSDGWSVEWNTTQMQDASYLICARMVDKDNNEGLSMTLVHIQNRLATDLNGDGFVNIIDIAIVARAFGAKPGDPKWNPLADIAQPYGEINIVDVAAVAKDYGKSV